MPRIRRATKACQTDSVVLCEEQVEHIVNQHVSDLKSKLQILETEMRDSKLAQTKMPAIATIEQLMTPNLNKIKEETEQLRANCEKIASDLDSLNNLQQAAEISIEQLQEQLDTSNGDIGRKLDNLVEELDNRDKIQHIDEKIDDI